MYTITKLKRICYNSFLFFILLLFFILPTLNKDFSIIVYFYIIILYFFTNLFKIYFFIKGIKLHNFKKYYEEVHLDIKDEDLPIYSIFLPVRNEKDFVLKYLLNSINNLDYPKNKLDIKLIIDEDDIETIKIANILKNSFVFDLIIVPYNNIVKSKPTSLNFALKYAKGDFLTIYDAEDRPEKYQLKKAVRKFKELDNNYVCLQASLNYYNKYDNFLSYCFSIEYSYWFDFTIRSIDKFANFFLLGGTSNHFKADKLLELGGWDGFNVTEDAELGVRIVKAGYKISILNSITDEECPITIKSWLKQRTRWIKGFMQTFFEYTFFTKPLGIKSKTNFKSLFKLNFKDLIIYKIFLMMSFFFFISIIAVFYNHIILLNYKDFKYLNYILYFNMFSLLFMIYISSIIVIIKNKLKIKPLYILFFPLYWILHYIASFYAVKSLITTPFYWAKTEHGVSKNIKK